MVGAGRATLGTPSALIASHSLILPLLIMHAIARIELVDYYERVYTAYHVGMFSGNGKRKEIVQFLWNFTELSSKILNSR